MLLCCKRSSNVAVIEKKTNSAYARTCLLFPMKISIPVYHICHSTKLHTKLATHTHSNTGSIGSWHTVKNNAFLHHNGALPITSYHHIIII